MTATDSAEQRRILRRTVEHALRQHTASKPGAAPALTEAVWRIVGPALASRDRVIAELAAVTETLPEVPPADDVIADAELPVPALAGIWETILRKYGSPEAQRPPACPCGAQRFAGQVIHEPGCWWTKTSAPLRQLAARALSGNLRFATGGMLPAVPTVRRDPRADDPTYDGITGHRTWEQVEADPPHFTGLLALLQAQASGEADHAAAVEDAIARVEAEHGPDGTITIPHTTTEG